MIEKISCSIKNFYGYGTMWKKTAAQEVRSSLTMKYVHSDLTQAVDGFRRPDLALTQDGLWEVGMCECVREELCL